VTIVARIQMTSKNSKTFNDSIIATAIDDPIADDVAKAVDVLKVAHVSTVAKNSKAFDEPIADHVEKFIDVSKMQEFQLLQKIQELLIIQ
jgi:hypothetical protein